MKPDATGAGYDPNAVPPEAAQMMAAMGPFFATFGLIMLLVFVFMIFCYWKIFAKAPE
jgi:type II secretory pathway component PulF